MLIDEEFSYELTRESIYLFNCFILALLALLASKKTIIFTLLFLKSLFLHMSLKYNLLRLQLNLLEDDFGLTNPIYT